jgi:hypothetical protein
MYNHESRYKTMEAAVRDASRFLRQDDRNRVNLHIADIASPIVVCSLDQSRDTIYGTATDGEQSMLAWSKNGKLSRRHSSPSPSRPSSV